MIRSLRRRDIIRKKNIYTKSHIFAITWLIFSVILSALWISDLAKVVTMPMSIIIVFGISALPGYVNTFFISTFIFSKKQKYQDIGKVREPVTILIACRNEAANIYKTLEFIWKQKYCGNIDIILIDNGSTDDTCAIAEKVCCDFGMSLTIVTEPKKGKYMALNKGLCYVCTKYTITIDGDTQLHELAINNVVNKIENASSDVAAVAGYILVNNSNKNILTKMQVYDYALSIGAIKFIQSAYNSTLVAQGAFSIYRTEDLINVGGWPDSIGEDIVLSWRLLKNGRKILFEPYAVAFTEVPEKMNVLVRQRSRWARGMIEALRQIKPWHQKNKSTRFLTGVNMILPYIDISYAFFFVPGVILAFMGIYLIAGLMTLIVLPLMFIQNLIYYLRYKKICKDLSIQPNNTISGFMGYIFIYQLLASYMSIIGYFQEVFKTKRNWRRGEKYE